jgi:hypothetical protein
MEDLENRVQDILNAYTKPKGNKAFYELSRVDYFSLVQALTKLVETEVRNFRNFCEQEKYWDEEGGICLATAYKEYLSTLSPEQEGSKNV